MCVCVCVCVRACVRVGVRERVRVWYSHDGTMKSPYLCPLLHREDSMKQSSAWNRPGESF